MDKVNEIITASRIYESLLINGRINSYVLSADVQPLILQAVQTYEEAVKTDPPTYSGKEKMTSFFSDWFQKRTIDLECLAQAKKKAGIPKTTRTLLAVQKTHLERETMGNPLNHVFPYGFQIEGVSIMGNPDMIPIMTGKLEKLINLLEEMDDSNFSMDMIIRELGPLATLPLADSMENTWKRLVDGYHGGYAQREDAICTAMHLITGVEYESTEIHGVIQAEWNRLYYMKGTLAADKIRRIEAAYFDTGDWWAVVDENGITYDVYTTDWDPGEQAVWIQFKTDQNASAVIMESNKETRSFLL